MLNAIFEKEINKMVKRYEKEIIGGISNYIANCARFEFMSCEEMCENCPYSDLGYCLECEIWEDDDDI